jgi:uncharacterized protein YyaL (SSP411 family)
MKNTKANRLINSTSPYLLQHAYNPVDWFEWSADALRKAKQEDKPILVSIGYSSCHWCHVMERESFENEDIAQIMNDFFVCIKVDREERPDIDHIYMDALQAMGQNGGWPLNVFLTPDQKPFYGGTYFHPQQWVQVLTGINKSYQTRKDEIVSSADELANHLAKQSISQFKKQSGADFSVSLNTTFQQLEAKFDYTWGGLDKVPKFIMPSIWLWLLRYHHLSKNQSALDHTIFTLKKIAQGGIYDQVGGGFARYSVDAQWFAPHFEKMLYDNAQLITLYSEAYAITKDEYFKTIVNDTYEWLTSEMTHSDGGFYSALDADSEGVEGKYYCWTYEELMQVLDANELALASAYFETTEKGNWEHSMNILKQHPNLPELAKNISISERELQNRINSIKQKLLAAREQRIKPGLDDKILTGWNAMMIVGLIDSYHTFSDERYLHSALKNAAFIQQNLKDGTTLYRSYKGRRSDTPGFLEDYAYVIQGWIKLYQATFNEQWIHEAELLTAHVLDNFYDTNEKCFYYSGIQSEKLIARKKEIFDNVIPSSNGIMAQNLYHLGILLDKEAWKNLATQLVTDLSHLIINEPNYMSNWGIVLAEINHGMAEVAFTGKNCIELKNQFKKQFQPFTLIMGAHDNGTLPLLKDKPTQNDTSMIYVCNDKTCKLPVTSVEEALQQII